MEEGAGDAEPVRISLSHPRKQRPAIPYVLQGTPPALRARPPSGGGWLQRCCFSKRHRDHPQSCFACTEPFFERQKGACKKPVKESSVGFGRPPSAASELEPPLRGHELSVTFSCKTEDNCPSMCYNRNCPYFQRTMCTTRVHAKEAAILWNHSSPCSTRSTPSCGGRRSSRCSSARAST